MTVTLDPHPRYLYSASKRHIARPDHPMGLVPTDIAFCGASARPAPDEGDTAWISDLLPTCKRCSVGWVAYLDRLARERDEALEDAAYDALRDLEEDQ